MTMPTACGDTEIWLPQKAKKLGEGGEAPPKPLPQWKVSEVRALMEALLQHGEDRTATTRKAVRDLCHLYARLIFLMHPDGLSVH